jgi:hypothetical protein
LKPNEEYSAKQQPVLLKSRGDNTSVYNSRWGHMGTLKNRRTETSPVILLHFSASRYLRKTNYYEKKRVKFEEALVQLLLLMLTFLLA